MDRTDREIDLQSHDADAAYIFISFLSQCWVAAQSAACHCWVRVKCVWCVCQSGAIKVKTNVKDRIGDRFMVKISIRAKVWVGEC